MSKVSNTIQTSVKDLLNEDILYSNGLSPAQTELIAKLMEECGEIIQECGKILIHGLDSKHPDGGPTNRANLEKEMGDVKLAIKLMNKADMISEVYVDYRMVTKGRTIGKFLHHNKQLVEDFNNEE